MRPILNRFYVFLLILCVVFPAMANNIQVSNVIRTGKNTADQYMMLQFNLSWENSWRTSSAPNNWDAAWVFVKYRISVSNGGDGIWKHAWLNNTGHTAGTGSTIDPGFRSPELAYNASTNPALGAFVYRSGDGTGTFSATGMQLRWNYGDNGVADDAVVEIKIFAVEMVYVPSGSFYIGSGGTETSAFYKHPTTTNPYQVTSENAITVGPGTDHLYYPSTTSGGDQTGPVPANFPKGFASFYCQKYEISQQQYVDFLNTLTQTQANSRKYTSTLYRYAVTGSTVGNYTTTNPYVACNYLSWMDGAAYADWSGMRPMTELEFEKACRGTVTPVANEYAWGTALVAGSVYSLSNSGEANEGIATNYSTVANTGNANYLTTNSSIEGPLRVGIFAANTTTTGRITAGASYYGMMELSGNLWERAVTIGHADGRVFTGEHGNGELNSAGHADVIAWPGLVSGEVTGATGSGFRGGSWFSSATAVCASDRYNAADPSTNRISNSGFRAVRTPSQPPGQPSAINGPEVPCQNTSGNIYSVDQMAGVSYNWSVPTGWSITAGQGSHEITLTAGTAAGDIVVIPSNAYGSGQAGTLAVTTTLLVPGTPTEGTHVPATGQIEWHWNVVPGATGYKWNTTNDYAGADDMGTSTSYTETGLLCAPCGVTYTRYVWAYTSCGASSELTMTGNTSTCPTTVVDVTNPTTGEIWMDRNLGAVQAATSSTDAAAYGDLYQWGRGADGHQCRTSSVTSTPSSSNTPGHGNFIAIQDGDWRSPKNDNLWQGVSGVNNPCPTGYRLPTIAELDDERLSWSGNVAFNSPLKFPRAGKRFSRGDLNYVGSEGYLWSSTVNGNTSWTMYFYSVSNAGNFSFSRADGQSVRCIKN